MQVRIRTGVVYIGITLGCILLGEIPTVLMLAATAGICAGEFYYMVRRDAKLPNELLGIIAAVLYPISVYFAGWAGLVVVTVALMLSLLIWYVFWTRARIGDVSVSFFGACYTGMLLSGLIVIRMAVPGFWGSVLLLSVYASVWANDSFAYLVGSKLGRHKLAPQLSPKKSWEGFLAGLLFSGLAFMLVTLIPGVTLGLGQAFLFGVICGVMEVLGDLAESRIKRNVGVKDSGTIMPGHGGLLDRCDSLFLASITAALLLVGSGAIPFSM
ncbi:MAG: phosphatidate cytidylyltransferase [Coriobacteriia bacterium]|nr:phosphatidate cytidylyltransferase [Coriobacteriia bacterium]